MSEEMIVKHCSPTLAGLKTGNLFSCSYQDRNELFTFLREWNTKLRSKEAGITSIKDYFSVSNAKTELSYLRNTDISCRGYMLGYNDLKDPSVPGIFRLLAKIGDGFMKMQIVRLDFGG